MSIWKRILIGAIPISISVIISAVITYYFGSIGRYLAIPIGMIGGLIAAIITQ